MVGCATVLPRRCSAGRSGSNDKSFRTSIVRIRSRREDRLSVASVEHAWRESHPALQCPSISGPEPQQNGLWRATPRSMARGLDPVHGSRSDLVIWAVIDVRHPVRALRNCDRAGRHPADASVA